MFRPIVDLLDVTITWGGSVLIGVEDYFSISFLAFLIPFLCLEVKKKIYRSFLGTPSTGIISYIRYKAYKQTYLYANMNYLKNIFAYFWLYAIIRHKKVLTIKFDQ